MTTRQERARKAWYREQAEWASLRKAANDKVNACTDIETMQEALRDFCLARADEEAHGNRASPWVRIWRLRANSEFYRRVRSMMHSRTTGTHTGHLPAAQIGRAHV